MNVMDVLKPWETINTALGLSGPIRDEAHYAALLAFVDECFDHFGADDHHPVFALVEIAANRIREFEATAHPWPDQSTPASRLKFLMTQHGLKQADFPEVGPQSVVSEILAGKRQLNLRQAKALANRFQIAIEVFAD